MKSHSFEKYILLIASKHIFHYDYYVKCVTPGVTPWTEHRYIIVHYTDLVKKLRE